MSTQTLKFSFDNGSVLGKSPDYLQPTNEDYHEYIFKKINSDTEFVSGDFVNNGYNTNVYDNLAYVDLNNIHNPDASFSLVFSAKETSIDISKPVNFVTFGYQIRGKSHVTMTIGRDLNSDEVTIGTITSTGTDKAIPVGGYSNIADTEYTYTLVYNSYTNDNAKVKLYRDTDLVCTSETMSNQNFSIVDRKLFLGTTAWTNESGWNESFDIDNNLRFTNTLEFTSQKIIDPQFYYGHPNFPVHFTFSNTTSSFRDSKTVAKTDDIVQLYFHSTYDVPQATVKAYANGIELTQRNDLTDPNYELPGNNITTMYVYEFTVTNSWPGSGNGLVDYNFDFDGALGSLTPSNNVMFIDNTAPTALTYTISNVEGNALTVQFSSLEDEYLNVIRSNTPTDYSDYSITFFASNSEYGIESNILNNPTENDKIKIIGLQSESVYYVYANLYDVCDNVYSNVAPVPGNLTSPVETSDITQPVITGNSLLSIKNDTSSKPGIEAIATVFDTAAKVDRPFSYYVAAFDYDLGNDDNTRLTKLQTIDGLVTSNIYINSSGTETSNQMYKYYTNTDAERDMTVENQYYIFFAAQDQAGNLNTSKLTHIINNTVTFSNIYTETIPGENRIAENNDKIFLEFNSLYATSNNEYTINMVGDSITPYSLNGYNWTVSNVVNSSHPIGEITYNVSPNPDISTLSSFDQNVTAIDIYIQNLPPHVNNVFVSSTTDTLTVSQIKENILDYTITNNSNPFQLTFKAYNTSTTNIDDTHTSNYSYLDQVESLLVLSGLAEATNYNVLISISNVYTESNDIIVGNETTQSDLPTISLATQVNIDSGDPVIEVLNTSQVFERNTAYYFFVEACDFEFNSIETMSNFFETNATKKGQNIVPNPTTPSNILDFMNPYITNYWTSNTGGYFNCNMEVSTTKTFNTYGLIYDTISYNSNVSQVTFTYDIANISLSNSDQAEFVKYNDIVYLNWTTVHNSKEDNFSASILGNVVTINSNGDDNTWQATYTLPSSGSLPYNGDLVYFDVNYVDTNYTTPQNNLFVDVENPTFTFTKVTANVDNIIMQISDFTNAYSNQSFPDPQSNLFTVNIIASNILRGESNNLSTQIFNNVDNNYTVINLFEGAEYYLSAQITDPAGNSTTVEYTAEPTIRTLDNTNPIIVTLGNATNNEGDLFVESSGVQVYDFHTEFDVYVGLFESNPQTPTIAEFFNNVGTGAVLSYLDNPATLQSSAITLTSGNLTHYIPYSTQWDAATSIQYSSTYLLRVMAIDLNSNVNIDFTDSITVNVLDEPLSFSSEATYDPSGVAGGIITRMHFGSNEFGFFGVDQSGNNNHGRVAQTSDPLSTDSAVGDYSLCLDNVTDVSMDSDVNLSTTFTYTTWFKNKNNPIVSDLVLLYDGTTPLVSISATTITVDIGGLTQTFTYSTRYNQWIHFGLIATGTTFTVLLDGQELTYDTNVGTLSTGPGNGLKILGQTGLCIDDTRFYNIALDVELVQRITHIGGKLIHLELDEGYTFDYDITVQNDKFYLNNVENPSLTVNENNTYTFCQCDSTNDSHPFVFSSDGSISGLLTDSQIVYYIDDVSIGTDPYQYIIQFNDSQNRKIKFTPTSVQTVYYMCIHDHDSGGNPDDAYGAPVSVISDEVVVLNAATTLTQFRPTFTNQISYVNTNAAIGTDAMSFTSSDQQFLQFNGVTFSNLDMDKMSISTWLYRTTDGGQSKLPIFYKDNLEFGLSNDGKLYTCIVNSNVS